MDDTPPPLQEDVAQASVRQRAIAKLERDMGPQLLDLLADPRTVEVMLNPDGRVYWERLGAPPEFVFSMRAPQAEAVIKTLAGIHGREVTRSSPWLECELPTDGSRFAGQVPPIVRAPTFAIRKRALAVFKLQEYVERGIMTPAHCEAILAAIQAHRNILVVGGTGSGKTTLLNAIISAIVDMDHERRVVLIEDTPEIQCTAKNVVPYRTTPEMTMTRLLRITLRMRPDLIFVGEVRGPEALDLLMAWNSGHDGGAASLHATDAIGGLHKLVMLVSMHPDSPKPIEPLIAQAVHVVVHIERTPDGRRVREVLEVSGYEDGRYVTRSL